MLVWDEVDVLAVLEIEADKEPNGLWHKYSISKDGIELNLTIYQYDAEIHIELKYSTGESLFNMRILDCPGIQRVYENENEYLNIGASQCFGASRYDGESVIPYGVRIKIKPKISISVYG